jgi:2-polyprenyl-6-methoxyphenol hydroxylase-like FAD-dependent oxidoreductase
MSVRTVIVVGGGIGGLATAIALHGRGWQVRVLERAGGFAEVGAGISLMPNAMRALDAVGVGPAVRALGASDIQGALRNPAGRRLSNLDPGAVTDRYGTTTILHRADLLRVLVAALPADCLMPATAASEVAESPDGVTVTHSHGSMRADLVVGADGLRSTVRAIGWPTARPPRYAGYTAWRMVAGPLSTPVESGGETWGAGIRFGYTALPDGRVYCYATRNQPEGTTSADGELAELRRLCGDWHDPIPRLLDAVQPDAVLRHDIYDLPDLPSFVQGRLVLLGDAAHAMTPNLGQGAGQALEDAATLGAVLEAHSEVPVALARYDALRRPRTQAIVKQSRRMGAVGQWSWRPAVVVRDRLFGMVPASAMTRSLGPVLNWPPTGGIA